jgi:hypothetical protein
VLLAQYLASGKTFKLLESEESADLDYVPSPDGDRLLIIEWNKGHPAWNYEYWARVVLLDLKSLVLRELVGPEEFPSLPMWIDNQRVAVLLDGRQGVTLNTETLERQKPVLLPAYPRDKGGSIEYDDGLQLVYVRRLGSGARLQRTAQLIKETDPLIGFLSFHGKDVYKISQVGAFGLPQCVIPPLLRSFGLPQFPSDWMLGSVPLQEPFMGEGLRRVRARKPELSLSPDGNFVAYSGLRDPAQGWEGGFEAGILDLRSKKKVSRIELIDADVFRFHWTANSRWVVYTQEGDSPPGYGSPGLWLLERSSSRSVFLGEGENGYLVLGPVGEVEESSIE